jgi:Fe2+ or Zn2+ uptake regulation protein
MIKRLTKQKQALLNVLCQEPKSVQQIEAELAQIDKKMDQSTIYRNLNAMVENGLLTATTFDQKTKLYELAHHEHHHHVLCEKCGKIGDICLDENLLLEQVKKQSNFSITGHHLEFFGCCGDCKPSAKNSTKS